MISDIQYFEIQKLLDYENVDELIACLLREYSQRDEKNGLNLLQLLPGIASKLYSQMLDKIGNKERALIYSISIPGISPKEKALKFAGMTPVCKEIFPHGFDDFEKSSPDMRKFFLEYIKLFQDDEAYSFSRDKSWSDLCGYTSYLEMIRKQLKSKEYDNEYKSWSFYKDSK